VPAWAVLTAFAALAALAALTALVPFEILTPFAALLRASYKFAKPWIFFKFKHSSLLLPSVSCSSK
jgi:hypothetical protein